MINFVELIILKTIGVMWLLGLVTEERRKYIDSSSSDTRFIGYGLITLL